MHFSSRGRRSRGLAGPGSWAATSGTLLAGGGPALAADAAASAAASWWFATTALFVVVLAAVAGALFGTQRSERRLASALRASQRDRQVLQQLLDVWSWQTDAQHRLLHIHPPAGAAADAWGRAPAAGQPLWDCFELADATDVAGLRPRLESQAALSDLGVQSVGSTDAWTLRASPRWDEQGRFAGHTGTAREAGVDLAARRRAQAIEQLLCDEPGPVLLATVTGPSGWQLQHANAAALELLCGDPAIATPAWNALLEHLPEPLRQTVAAVVAGPAQPAGRAEVGGWRLRHAASADGSQRALLLTRPAVEPAASPPADDRSEGESFGYTLSHDLRAPIRVVDGFTRILKEDYGHLLDRVGNDHLDRVLSAAARMNQMIDALLTLARLSSLPLAQQPVNLTQLAGFVVDDLRRSAPERLADIEVQPALQVVGDPTLLRLVLENLLGNAWKYSARVPRAHIGFGAELRDGRRVFVVRDNGAGFDMRSAERLFGLFQRLHSASDFAGTGVGLASVKRIVHRHGGQVWAEGEPGRGAAFYFTLRGG
jgi:signal transduction histidine kinase